MAVRMLFQIGPKLLTSIAFLDGVPEGKIESFRGDFLGCRRRGTWRRERSCIKPCSGERGEGALRILLEVGFELGRAALLDAAQSASSRTTSFSADNSEISAGAEGNSGTSAVSSAVGTCF